LVRRGNPHPTHSFSAANIFWSASETSSNAFEHIKNGRYDSSGASYTVRNQSKEGVVRFILLALAFASIATTAAAARWTSAGWYQIANGLFGVYIYAGPFTDADSCERTLLPDDKNTSYNCDFLAERPGYDR
jgi:hypothetical protein